MARDIDDIVHAAGDPVVAIIVSPRTIEILVASGLLLFAAVGFANLGMGGNFLDYRVIDSHDPKHGLHYGIIIIELGVGITVTAAMLAIFYAFAGRERR